MRQWILLVFVLLIIMRSGATISAASNSMVHNLRCEYLANPLGVDVPQPRLSWMLRSSKRGESQTAYQMLVASSENLLAADKGDVWDSGKVQSNQSVHVPYSGRELKSGERCWWKVRIWTRDGNPSHWSKPAFWTMGLLSPKDWRAKWIAAEEKLPEVEPSVQKTPSPLFRKKFEINKPIRNAYAYTCGLGFYELRLNGKKVGDEVLQPEFTRYDKRALYVTKDVTKLLKQGKNAIGVMLGNGWLNSQARDAWDFDRAPWRQTPRLLLQMTIDYADGTSQTIISDETWKTTPGPIIFDCIRNGETYDARLNKRGWDKADYSDTGWKPVVVVNGPTDKLVARKMPPVRVIKTIEPVKITEPKPGIFVFDFGRNISGWGRLRLSGPAGTKVTIEYDERLTEEGVVDRRQAGLVYSGRFQVDTYILKGKGVENWEPRFVYHGFQYAQVEGFPGKPTKESLRACVVHTDFEQAGSFECSNDLLNRIQRAAERAYLSNFVGYPTDCPHREKNGWTGDAHLAAEMGLYAFNSAAGYTKWLDDFDDAQTEAGDLPGIVPTTGWGYGVGPAWDSAYILIPWYMYLYRGDKGILADHYDGFKRYVDYLTSKSEGHIVTYGLGDWSPPAEGPEARNCPAELTSTAYYYIDTLLLARMAGLLGKEEDARQYSELARDIRAAFNKKFYDKSTGLYAGDCQTSQCAPLYQGLAEPKEETKILEKLLEQIDKADGHLWCGILGAKYILHALTDNGKIDTAYRIATQTTFPSWGYWIKEQNATTLFEHWNGLGSRNHIMFGDISAWFFADIAGIKPDPEKPGFKHIIIRPRPVGDLKWAKAEHMSMYGRIRNSWSRTNDEFRLEIEIPANTTASVYLPGEDASKITESGNPLGSARGVTVLGPRDGCSVVGVGAGIYTFVIRR